MSKNASKSGKKTGLGTFRPRREQQRMTYKKRLARSRQGLVLRHSHDATSCGPGMWISGTRRALVMHRPIPIFAGASD